MQMAMPNGANRELQHRSCRCHEPARGHVWDPIHLRCTNASCTRTWAGQQEAPTDCEHPRVAADEQAPVALAEGPSDVPEVIHAKEV